MSLTHTQSVPNVSSLSSESPVIPAVKQNPVRSVPFTKQYGFRRTVVQRVEAFLKENGLRTRDLPGMYVKSAICLGWWAISYGLMLYSGLAEWSFAVTIIMALSFGLATGSIGFNIMHDANHNGYSDRPWVNRLLGLTVEEFDPMPPDGGNRIAMTDRAGFAGEYDCTLWADVVARDGSTFRVFEANWCGGDTKRRRTGQGVKVGEDADPIGEDEPVKTAIARAAQSEEELFEARRRLEAELRPWRSKMTAAQLALLEKQYLERRLLEAAGLPRLSLFYLQIGRAHV